MRGKWYRDLDVEAYQELSGYALYESLLTYVAHMDLVGDPLQCGKKTLVSGKNLPT